MKARRGFALIAALWLIVAIAAVTLHLGLEGRDRRLMALRVVEHSVASAAAQGALDLAVARLERVLRQPVASGAGANALRSSDPWLGIDTLLAEPIELGDVSYDVKVRDLGTTVNINTATLAQLQAFMTALRLDAPSASRLATAIIDWRDADDTPQLGGAEREDYIAEGNLILPSNTSFQNVEELRSVMGMTSDLYEIMSPYLATRGSGRVNLNAAESPVLHTVPGITEAMINVLLGYRSQGRRVQSVNELVQAGGGVGDAGPRPQTETLLPAGYRWAAVTYTRPALLYQVRGGGGQAGGGGGGQAGGGGGAAGGGAAGGRGAQPPAGGAGRGAQPPGGPAGGGRGAQPPGGPGRGGGPAAGGGRGGAPAGGGQNAIVQRITQATTLTTSELEVTITGWNSGRLTPAMLVAVVQRGNGSTTTIPWRQAR